jgi:hypothetical protein
MWVIDQCCVSQKSMQNVHVISFNLPQNQPKQHTHSCIQTLEYAHLAVGGSEYRIQFVLVDQCNRPVFTGIVRLDDRRLKSVCPTQ